jgi:chemotaxis protein MotB
MAEKGKRPIWLPTGGVGALLFWGGLCAFLGVTTLYYFNKATYQEAQGRVLQDQEQLLFRENQQLRSQVDKLQTDLAEKGSILLNREQILQQTTESLKEVQKEKELQASLPPPDPKKPLHDLFQRLDQSFKAQPALAACSLVEGDSGVILRVNNNLLFNPGELGVNANGVDLLKQIALFLKDVATASDIELQSHTDDLDPTGPLAAICPTNWEVSGRRASSVLRVLATDGGLPAKNLKAVAMGDTHPIVPNDSKDNRALNRRLDIVMMPGG